jgi:hypothetical protein
VSGQKAIEQALHPGLAVRALGRSRIGLKGMFVIAARAAMKSKQCRDYEHPRIGRCLGDRSLQLLDPGEAALESAGHF